MKVVTVIPARYGSTRLPAKPLADIHGKPMVQWVYERASRARGIARTVVATDDERVASVVRDFGGEVVMTSTELASGTDRVAAVADRIEGDIFVNVQGDEPLIVSEAIERAVELVRGGRFPMSTVMTSLKSSAELHERSVVKVIADRTGRAIYFSRLPIPYGRGPEPAGSEPFVCFRHVGLYVYDRATLMRFRALPPSPLEKAEVLEQLRALAEGIPIGIAEVEFRSIGVDTPEDLDQVRRVLV
ncbi:MAG: 3-deoxy-manno-octulosonate cytidylyltransferase [Oligoflexia bacterium]|nr:3-deoxy-manno-octulosonate cytidylyltransferase [Oligoflexia bacterium]